MFVIGDSAGAVVVCQVAAGMDVSVNSVLFVDPGKGSPCSDPFDACPSAGTRATCSYADDLVFTLLLAHSAGT